MTETRDIQRYTVDGVGRIYTVDDVWLPSVTTVLSMRPVPEALKRWKQNNDDHEEITRYKQNRGTMIHYDCLNEFSHAELWSDDEASSKEELQSDPDDWERFCEEREWARETWDLIKRVTEIGPETVMDVETFVTNEAVGYGGQFDLLYHDPSADETVLADLKTGKSVYEKNLLQGVAYKKAVPVSIDRIEVIRMNPDNQDWYISTSHEWPDDNETRWNEFVDLRCQLESERLSSIEGHIKELIETDDLDAEAER